MVYAEIVKDLFSVNLENSDNPYCLAHCISADFAMAGGIVLGFNERFNMKMRLITKYKDRTEHFRNFGAFILPEKCFTEVSPHNAFFVYNLITKRFVTDRPTYKSLEKTLLDMKNHMVSLGLTRLAIPTLGCGIDGLDWDEVRRIIHKVFENTHIEILVCRR